MEAGLLVQGPDIDGYMLLDSIDDERNTCTAILSATWSDFVKVILPNGKMPQLLALPMLP